MVIVQKVTIATSHTVLKNSGKERIPCQMSSCSKWWTFLTVITRPKFVSFSRLRVDASLETIVHSHMEIVNWENHMRLCLLMLKLYFRIKWSHKVNQVFNSKILCKTQLRWHQHYWPVKIRIKSFNREPQHNQATILYQRFKNHKDKTWLEQKIKTIFKVHPITLISV